MNAFTIPTKSVMHGTRPPVRADYKNGGHWRGLPVIGAKQSQIDTDRRRAMQKPSHLG